MITWGMVGNSPDASLAVFHNDDLLWANHQKTLVVFPMTQL